MPESENIASLQRRLSALNKDKAELEALVDRMMKRGTVAGIDQDKAERMSHALRESLALNLVVVSNHPKDESSDATDHWKALLEVVHCILQIENPDATWEDAVRTVARVLPKRES